MGGDPSGVPGETKTPFSHVPQSCGGVLGTISPPSSRSSYLRRERRQMGEEGSHVQLVLRSVLSKRHRLTDADFHVIKPEIG